MFQNRHDAGTQLAKRLNAYRKKTLVFGIPRGGLVVAAAVAKLLQCPLYPLIVRKIGFPQNPEFAAGAVGPDGKTIWNETGLALVGLKPADFSPQIRQKIHEVEERKKLFRVALPPPLQDQVVLVVDDGAATGSTLQAALLWLKTQKPREMIVALPCASKEAEAEVRKHCNRMVCLQESEAFSAVGQFYRDFSEVSDAQALACLEPFSKNTLK